MSPEQARRDVASPSSDIFSLGLVLFECLTGRRCFEGTDLFEVLARIVIDEVPRTSDVREGLPDHFDQLIARMTQKDPTVRPSADEVVGDIEALLRRDAVAAASVRPTITSAERRLLAVVVASAPGTTDLPAQGDATTITDLPRRSEPLADVARRLGAKLDMLRDGSVLAVVGGGTEPAELCSRAARLAIEMQRLLGDAPIAVATGRAASGQREAVRELITRAATLIARRAPGISLDDVTEALLPAHFRFEFGVLRGERDLVEPTPLLGRRTTFLGRDRELAVLRGLFDECKQESIPRAVLVTGAAGIGKSRIASELLAGLRRDRLEVELLVGAGDPIGAAPFGLLSRATQGVLGVLDGDSTTVRRRKVAEHVARHVDKKDRERIAELLAELIGGGSSAVAPQASIDAWDPIVLGDRMRVAWQDWVAAIAASRPVVLLLDDLHWGDLATVKVVDLALRNLSDRPLFVLALARPEVRKRFPDLWSGRDIQQVHLSGLRARACSTLVREALGETISPQEVAELVERTGGNPFFLEETIRASARGDVEAPESVLATVQMRLEELPEEGRRVLRAASVFGTRFWVSGVRTLLGKNNEPGEWLKVLADGELVQPSEESAYAGHEEFVFRHALVRDAAYALLVDNDRALGHRLAGDWLERVGSNDPAVLAEHFSIGGAPSRAAIWYQRAAQRALEGDDLSLVLDYVERARACDPDDETIGSLHLLEAHALWVRGSYADGERAASAAMQSFATGATDWFRAARLAVYCALHASNFPVLELRIADIRHAQAAPGAEKDRLTALFAATEMMYFRGSVEEGDLLLKEATERFELTTASPGVTAALLAARTIRAAVCGDLEESLHAAQAATNYYLAAGDVRGAGFAKANLGHAYKCLGDLARSAETSTESLSLVRATGGDVLVAVVNLGEVQARLGRGETAIRMLQGQIERLASVSTPQTVLVRTTLAFAYARVGRLSEAEAEAREAVTGFADDPSGQGEALAVLADVLLRADRPAEALVSADRAITLMNTHHVTLFHEGLLRLVRVAALLKLGNEAEADRALHEAKDRITTAAAKIQDPDLRSSFLTKLEEHARVLELAAERGL
jgi:tetratricopeptide (TPR) repeat protein